MKKNFCQLAMVLLLSLYLTGCSIAGKTEEKTSESEDIFRAEQQESLEAGRDESDFKSDTSDFIKKDNITNRSMANQDEDILEVHYIDIGQGDAILIKQGDAAMLIDAGNNSKGTAVWSYLLSQKVEYLNYAIGTHPDADHIGGLDVVLYKLDYDTLFLPVCKSDTQTYRELMEAIKAKNKKSILPKQGETYFLGKAQFQILTDTNQNYGDNTNNFSIAIRLLFGDTSFLFTGDAEAAAEQDMLNNGLLLESDVFKAAHHGADSANTKDFLTAVNPQYCVISCGEDNAYGHPRAGVLNDLRIMGVKVFRTDEQGTIVATSDGETVTFNCSPSVTWKAGEPKGREEADTENETGSKSVIANAAGDYVLNLNTKKFHNPDCKNVNKISDKNKKLSEKSREDLILDGYEPCKICNP